jgi:ribulose-phosphate 3-epimerase
MDNVFVPNFTFDFDSASRIIQSSPIPVDSHLMVADVDEIAIAYAEAGCASVTIHVEACRDIRATTRGIRRAGARAALALKPETEIDEYQDFLNEIDMFLIMTVEPGFGGQSFMEDMLPKARQIIGDRPIWLQVDGGISISTIERASAAGADTFVAGSAVFNASDPAKMVRQLRNLALTSHSNKP